MKITVKRISLYLKQVKSLVNYHLNLRDKQDREATLKVIQISCLLSKVETKLRELQKYLVEKVEVTDERAKESDKVN